MNKKPSIYLITLLLVTAVFEFLRQLPEIDQKLVNSSYWIMNTVVIFGWCLAHARKYNNKPNLLMAALCGLIPPIGVPVYFYSNFGFKTGSVKLVLTLLFFFSLIFTSVVFEKFGQAYGA